jgi:hypothetical protein
MRGPHDRHRNPRLQLGAGLLATAYADHRAGHLMTPASPPRTRMPPPGAEALRPCMIPLAWNFLHAAGRTCIEAVCQPNWPFSRPARTSGRADPAPEAGLGKRPSTPHCSIATGREAFRRARHRSGASLVGGGSAAAGTLEQILPYYSFPRVSFSLLIVPEWAGIAHIRLLVDSLTGKWRPYRAWSGRVTLRTCPAAQSCGHTRIARCGRRKDLAADGARRL